MRRAYIHFMGDVYGVARKVEVLEDSLRISGSERYLQLTPDDKQKLLAGQIIRVWNDGVVEAYVQFP